MRIVDYPYVDKAFSLLVYDNIPYFAYEAVIHNGSQKQLPSDFNWGFVNEELSKLTDEQFEEIVIGEGIPYLISDETDRALNVIFEDFLNDD